MTETAMHRMADPTTRRRTAFVAAALVTLAWAVTTTLGKPRGPFTQRELPDLAGLPVFVPQIERLLPPRAGDLPIAPTQGATP